MKHFPSYLVLVAVIGIGISMYRHPPNGDPADGVVWRKVAVDARTSTVSLAVPPKDCARIKIDGDIFSTEACHDPRPHMVSLAGRIQEARTQDIAFPLPSRRPSMWMTAGPLELEALITVDGAVRRRTEEARRLLDDIMQKLSRDATVHYTDAEIETALIAHEDTELLYLAAAADQGKDGMSFGISTWWRLCEGRWTVGVQKYLPGITDAELGAFMKRYARTKRGVDPRSILSAAARGTTIMPGETVAVSLTRVETLKQIRAALAPDAAEVDSAGPELLPTEKQP
jgi:hypothetical protein